MDAIFYLPQIDLSLKQCELPREEAKHAIRVLRMQEGDTLLLTDGQGHFIDSEIAAIAGKTCTVSFKTIREERKAAHQLHLAVAPTKNSSRYEWLVEKATEIGVTTITPLLTFHSERRSVNYKRLEKIVIAAMKQSQKAYLPKLTPAITFSDFIKQCSQNSAYIAHCNSKFPRKSINETYSKGQDVTLLIGPEGDFSKDEIQQALNSGFESIHLGTSRLRTETAGLVACSTIYQLNY